MRTSALSSDAMEHVLALLTPQNELVCRVCLAGALRVSDALSLRTPQLAQSKITIREQKTGKRRVLQLSEGLRKRLAAYAGDVFVFPSRCDPFQHRSRQAVWKDIKRAQNALRLHGCLGSHSMRKSAAVRKYAACGDMRAVKALLNHSDELVTQLYALAEVVDLNRAKRG